jgi:hypothetical protein
MSLVTETASIATEKVYNGSIHKDLRIHGVDGFF